MRTFITLNHSFHFDALHNVCAVHQRMFSTLGGFHEDIAGCSAHTGDVMSTPGDSMINIGKVADKPLSFMEIPVY